MPVEVIANDLSAGRYDVDVVVGPSYSTQRQEAAESLIQFVQAVPQAGAAAADLIAKNMDWPGAEELADRLRKMLPPGIAEPKEGEQPAPPPPPNPLEQLKAQEMAAKNAKTAEEVKGLQLDNDAKALELSMQNGQLHEAIAQAVTQSLAQLFGQPGQPAGPAAPINPITPAPAGMPGQTA
jgi:hypothetical protein